MIGGLWKSTSSLAMFAAAGLFVGGVAMPSAKAADLGGDCCADLEERVAELEATTARKGNRKVSLTITGQVTTGVMYWNDGGSHVRRSGQQRVRTRATPTLSTTPPLAARSSRSRATPGSIRT